MLNSISRFLWCRVVVETAFMNRPNIFIGVAFGMCIIRIPPAPGIAVAILTRHPVATSSYITWNYAGNQLNALIAYRFRIEVLLQKVHTNSRNACPAFRNV
jgi:hypothetical protein